MLCVQRRSKANGRKKQPDDVWDEYYQPDNGEEAVAYLHKQRALCPHLEYRLVEEFTTEIVLPV